MSVFARESPYELQSSRCADLVAHAARPVALCAAPLGIQNQYRIAGVKTSPQTKLAEPNLRYSWCLRFRIIVSTHCSSVTKRNFLILEVDKLNYFNALAIVHYVKIITYPFFKLSSGVLFLDLF